MEEIGKIYGGFILEGIAVISLMLFLWCGISVGGDNKSILRIMAYQSSRSVPESS